MNLESKRRHLSRKQYELKAKQRMNEIVPVAHWDRGVFKAVAIDRGYKTDAAIAFAVSKGLEVTLNTAKHIIETGALTWGQVLVLGSLFEMTPKEFADVFLKDYFVEQREGVWVAFVADPSSLLQSTVKGQIRKE